MIADGCKNIKLIISSLFILIISSCGGGGDSEAIYISPPEEVVEQAMLAQVNGDIDGFLANCAQEGVSAEQIAVNRDVMNAVKDNVSLSQFIFEPLATGIYGDSTVAIVRALTSFVINGTESVKYGVLAFLKKENSVWKIVKISPDDLLDQQIYEEGLLTVNSSAMAVVAAEPKSLAELNAELNSWLDANSVINVNVKKAIWDETFTLIGSYPGIGDVVALGEGFCSVMETSSQLYEECVSRGYSPVASARVAELKIGAVSLATEFIPGLDVTVKQVNIATSQMADNLERQQAIRELRAVFLGKDMTDLGFLFNPYVSMFPNYSYPDGLMDFDDVIDHNFPTLTFVKIFKPEWLGGRIPLTIYGYMEFDVNTGWIIDDRTITSQVAEALGGEFIGDNLMHLDVDVTEMFDGQIFEGEEEPAVHVVQDSYSPEILSADITCIAYNKDFSVAIQNGEETESISVSTFMIAVDSLKIITGDVDIDDKPVLNLFLGSAAEEQGLNVANDIKIFSTFPFPNDSVELTETSDCLQLHIQDPEFAMLEDEKSITSIKAVSPGETVLDVVFDREGTPIHTSVRIIVHASSYVDIYIGEITSVVDDSPIDIVSCFEMVGDESSAFVSEDGKLFYTGDFSEIGYINDGQLHADISGDVFTGTVDSGTWSDGQYCSGTYIGYYLTLEHLHNWLAYCESTSECSSSFEGELRALIDLKEALL